MPRYTLLVRARSSSSSRNHWQLQYSFVVSCYKIHPILWRIQDDPIRSLDDDDDDLKKTQTPSIATQPAQIHSTHALKMMDKQPIWINTVTLKSGHVVESPVAWALRRPNSKQLRASVKQDLHQRPFRIVSRKENKNAMFAYIYSNRVTDLSVTIPKRNLVTRDINMNLYIYKKD